MRIALAQQLIVLLAAHRVAQDGERCIDQCSSLVITAEIGMQAHLHHQGSVTRLDDGQRRIRLHVQHPVIVTAIPHSGYGRLFVASLAEQGNSGHARPHAHRAVSVFDARA
jgi:hypothetical protein